MKKTMKKIITATVLLAATLAVLAAPADAQIQRKGGPKPEDPTAAAERREKEAADRAYENAVRNTANRDKRAPQDPWATVREPGKK